MQNDNSFHKPYSEQTAWLIDKRSKELIEVQYKRAIELLTDRYKDLEKIAKELLKREVIYKYDLEELIGERPFNEKQEKEEAKLTEDTKPPEMREEGQEAQKESKDKPAADEVAKKDEKKSNENGSEKSSEADNKKHKAEKKKEEEENQPK